MTRIEKWRGDGIEREYLRDPLTIFAKQKWRDDGKEEKWRDDGNREMRGDYKVKKSGKK